MDVVLILFIDEVTEWSQVEMKATITGEKRRLTTTEVLTKKNVFLLSIPEEQKRSTGENYIREQHTHE